MGLENFKDLLATSAMISTMAHMLSGTIICKNFYKNKTSKGFDPSPFIGGIGMAILMLRYALILKDPIMISVNIFGVVVNILYVITYLIYSPAKGEAIQLLGKCSGIVLLLLTYAEYESKEHLEFRFGIIVTTLFLLLIASPFLHLKTVIETKDSSILPFPLIFMGTIVFFQWLLYGMVINNGFIIFQNGLGFAMSVIQLSLFAIYPSKPKDAKKSE